MRVPLLLFAAVAAVIGGAWAWLGQPVAMPPSPLGAGEKLYCVSYAPFRGSQSPLSADTHIDAQQIDDDLARLARLTGCVRTYSIEHGLDQVPAIAARHGLAVMQGIWLSSNPAKNRVQIDTVVALAKQHPDTIRAVIVGNEVLLRGEMGGPELAATIRQVKAAVTVPVTYADVWEFWLRHREIYAAVDFVTIHILPYWEDIPVRAEAAGAHVDLIRSQVAAAFPDKEILIGEVGWPSAGRMREGALPSPADQARVLHDVLGRAKAGGYRVNVIEAFDQPWKRALEGTVGGHWGLFDDRLREPKFSWGVAVSNHSQWRMQLAAGIALAAAVFLAAWTARRRDAPPLSVGSWAAVAAVAVAAGVPIGITIEMIPIESLGVGGWLRSLTLAAMAVAAPMVAAAALAAGRSPPAFAQLLGGTEGRPADPLSLALGGLFLALCVLALQVALGLVFNPRYLDFPLAPLAAPVAAYMVLAFAGPARARDAGTSERMMAGVLLLSAGYIALNEGFSNWQAQSLAAALIALAATLLRFAGVRSLR